MMAPIAGSTRRLLRRSMAMGRALAASTMVMVLASCGGGDRPTSELGAATPAERADLGGRVYARSCASCHGGDGQGGIGPKLADGAVVESYPDPAEHRQVVVQGKGQMPALGDTLSDEEIDAVVRYEREQL